MKLQIKMKQKIIKIGHIFQNHLYRILITGGSRLRKSNAILNLISHQVDIDKILLYIQDL